MKLYKEASYSCSRMITEKYSTSFSIGVRCLDPAIRDAVYAIYGFVRLADEIVDTFHEYDKEKILDRLVDDYRCSCEEDLSINPVVNAFVHTVKKYGIDDSLIDSFIKSMRSDIEKKNLMKRG